MHDQTHVRLSNDKKKHQETGFTYFIETQKLCQLMQKTHIFDLDSLEGQNVNFLINTTTFHFSVRHTLFMYSSYASRKI